MITHVEVVKRPGELSGAGVLAQAGILVADALSSVGDPGHGLLQLLVDELAVGLVGGHVWVLQAGPGRRVQQRNVPLQNAAGRRHLFFMMHVLQLLCERVGGEKERASCGYSRSQLVFLAVSSYLEPF